MDNQLAKITVGAELISRWEGALDLDVKAGDISSSSKVTYYRGMEKFYTWLVSQNVDQVSGKVVQLWKAELLESGCKPSAVNTWLGGVKRFFRWAYDEGLLVVNPVANIKGAKRKGTNKRHLRDALTDREVLRVLGQPDRSTVQGRRDYAILALKAYCGVRDVEVHRADLGDFSTVDGLPVLRVQGKGYSEKNETAVIFHSAAQEAVYDWLADRGSKPGPLFISLSNRSHGERLGISAIRHLVIGYYRKAGVVDPRKTSHSLRHSAITKVARHDILKARQVARHSSIDTTMIYVHEADRLDNPGEAFIDYVNGNGNNH
jgi:integrase/recombinase XerD